MTVALGSNFCPVLGCTRRRHRSESIHYGTCLAHATALLHRAFGPDSPTDIARVPASPEWVAGGVRQSVPALSVR